MFKICLFEKLAASLVLLSLALVLDQSLCKNASNQAKLAKEHVSAAFDHKMHDLFHDKELEDLISKYLEKVPRSHNSRAQAARFGNIKPSMPRSKRNAGRRLPRLGGEQKQTSAKSTLEQAKKAGSHDNTLRSAISSVIESAEHEGGGCHKCDPCPPVPKCAPCPESNCEKCPPCPITSNMCPPPKPSEKCPPEPVCEKCDDSGSKATQARTKISRTSKAASRSTTTRKPKSTTRKQSRTTSTTKASKSTTTAGHKTKVATNMIGSFLFDKNVRLIKNETLRNNFIKMIEEIPESVGGEEMQLADKILARLSGQKPPKPLNKGGGRSFASNTARSNAKRVIGFILDRVSRKKCSCKQCDLAPKCTCPPAPSCQPAKARCPPCEKSMPPTCPAPPACKEYPPCKECDPLNKMNPDDDGDNPDELDDVDESNPLKEGELKQEITCTGFTCPFEKNCGTAVLNPLTPKSQQSGYFMVGGNDAIYGEWPHYVRIGIDIPEIRFSGLCGGVLISDQHVLTAGHCVVRPLVDDADNVPKRISTEEFTVYLADHDRYKTDKFEQIRKVSHVCYSSKYNDPNSDGSRYDYSILTLSEKVKFNDHIQPACLPYMPVPDGSKCYVVGLGITKFENNVSSFADIVQMMPLVRTTCKHWGVKHNDRSRHCFTKANAPGDTCGGDSGGPVVCLSKSKRWTVQGLVSYGSPHCDGTEQSGWVGVYTRIPALMKQIQSDCKI